MRKTQSVVALALLLLVAPPWKRWFGPDKVKHFLMSAFVQSAAYSAARGAGAERSASHAIAGSASLSVGVWKEVRDRKRGGPFSVADLVWDGAGAASMAALLNRSR